MKNLQIDEKNAKTLYPSASPEFKAMLHDTFGEKFFQQKITDRVKSFEDACRIVGVHPESEHFTVGDPDTIAYNKLKVVIEALNEDWTPDWTNTDEAKYYPWFYMNGFRLLHVTYYYDGSSVGSRLCFQKREVAEYAVSQFSDLYKTFFTA